MQTGDCARFEIESQLASEFDSPSHRRGGIPLVWPRGHVGNVVPVRARVFESLSRRPTDLTEPICENTFISSFNTVVDWLGSGAIQEYPYVSCVVKEITRPLAETSVRIAPHAFEPSSWHHAREPLTNGGESMELTPTDKNRVATTTIDVTIRIPELAIEGLVDEAERRLDSIDDIHGVTIADVRGVKPRLSATLVTITGRIQHTVSVNELRERLAATVCIESVDRIAEVHQ